MVESAADPATHRVGQAFGGADALHQSRGKTAAESFIEDSNRIVIGIVPPDAESHHADRALVDVFFLNQVVTWLGRLGLDLFFLQRRAPRPWAEGLAKFGL